MFRSRTDLSACIFLFCLCGLIFTRGLNIHGLEYRDDEIFYFQATQEMLESGNVMSPTYFGKDRFQKPILFYWLILLSFKIFGVNWFAARLPSVICAALTVCLTWLLARELFSRRVATLSALIVMTAPLFFRHAKNAVPDMALNFFVVWVLYCAVLFIRNRKPVFNILFFVACGLGFMIKGYTAVLVPVGTVVLYGLMGGRLTLLKEMRFGRGLAILLAIIAPWFLYMVAVHGRSYLDYMLIDETKNRIITGGGPALLKIAATFIDHSVFYGQVIGSYFAPWSLFLIGALPLGLVRSVGAHDGHRFCVAWFLLVFCFFSLIYFSINHYMLVLSTPFAVLVAAFLCEPFARPAALDRSVLVLRRYVPALLFAAGGFAYIFVFIYLAGQPLWWLVLFLAVIITVLVRMIRSRGVLFAPLSLAFLILFVFAQTSILEKAGVTAHATLQKFAGTVNGQIVASGRPAVVAAGSHDIHEKEFQVYFDRKVVKAAGSKDDETRDRLNHLFATDQTVFCLITEKDYISFLKGTYDPPLKIVQEDYIVRRRMSLDLGFIMAVLRFDQAAVNGYIKEKLLLVKKEHNV